MGIFIFLPNHSFKPQCTSKGFYCRPSELEYGCVSRIQEKLQCLTCFEEIFNFLNPYAKRVVVVTGKAVNLGCGDGMQVPCMLKITGNKTLIDILTKDSLFVII